MTLDSVVDYGSNLTASSEVPEGKPYVGTQERAWRPGRCGLAAILASACCLGPLILVLLGFSGAWIANLAVLEPYRPIFIGAALMALFFARRSIFRPVHACKPDEVCAVPRVRTAYKIIFWIVVALVLIALAFPYVLPLFY